MIIYVAGKYSGSKSEVKENVKAAIEAGLKILQRGHVPIVPHLSHYLDKMADQRGQQAPWSMWMAMDFVLLDRCDALFLLSASPGANAEMAYAKKRNMPIYHKIEDIPFKKNYFSDAFPFRIDID